MVGQVKEQTRGFMRAVSKICIMTIRNFTVQELSNVLWAVARCGEQQDNPLFAEAYPIISSRKNNLRMEERAQIEWAFSTVGMNPLDDSTDFKHHGLPAQRPPRAPKGGSKGGGERHNMSQAWDQNRGHGFARGDFKPTSNAWKSHRAGGGKGADKRDSSQSRSPERGHVSMAVAAGNAPSLGGAPGGRLGGTPGGKLGSASASSSVAQLRALRGGADASSASSRRNSNHSFQADEKTSKPTDWSKV